MRLGYYGPFGPKPGAFLHKPPPPAVTIERQRHEELARGEPMTQAAPVEDLPYNHQFWQRVADDAADAEIKRLQADVDAYDGPEEEKQEEKEETPSELYAKVAAFREAAGASTQEKSNLDNIASMYGYASGD